MIYWRFNLYWLETLSVYAMSYNLFEKAALQQSNDNSNKTKQNLTTCLKYTLSALWFLRKHFRSFQTILVLKTYHFYFPLSFFRQEKLQSTQVCAGWHMQQGKSCNRGAEAVGSEFKTAWSTQWVATQWDHVSQTYMYTYIHCGESQLNYTLLPMTLNDGPRSLRGGQATILSFSMS